MATVAAGTDRKHIVLKRPPGAASLPFSDGILVGNTLYISGHFGLDPKTHEPPGSAEEEAMLAVEATKQTVEAAGMNMDDLVSIQVYCSDLSLYDNFNAAYRKYFHDEYPARLFVGSAKLLHGARYEISGVAVKK
jgi:reactive intermediate/imine deaminase